jgi:uncharacterized membrane protein YdfJ with MMPL/SSD domain
MAKRKFTEQEIESILNSLDGIQKAEPAPFFYTRLQARLMDGEDTGWAKVADLVTRPAFIIGVMSLILLVNGFFLFGSLRNEQPGADDNYTAIAADYANNSMAFYDINEGKP